MSNNFKNKVNISKKNSQKLDFGPRRALVLNIKDYLKDNPFEISDDELKAFETYDLIYRTVCGILYNFVPTSGHPGGSISSGRIVSSLLFNTMDYDFSDPTKNDADIISYAAGHKAMGLYGMWACRNEVARAGNKELLPKKENWQLRLEDLLGFRRNPTQDTPLFKKFNAKPLDGHPTPATPFIKISTGPSGIGVGSTTGLALGAMDYYSDNPPFVHIIEGEGGMTPGRVYEAIACLSTSRLWNTVMHIDWNQAAIDSDRVCRNGSEPGEYVQWDPAELMYLNDFNTIIVDDGFDFKLNLAAQMMAIELSKSTKQPTAIVYKTVKGWKYGIEGKASHGAGHKFCSDEYYSYIKTMEDELGVKFPKFTGDKTQENIEKNFYETLLVIRQAFDKNAQMTSLLSKKLIDSQKRLNSSSRKPRNNAPDVSKVYGGAVKPESTPDEVKLEVGSQMTLRGQLGTVLNHLNKISNGSILVAAADLYGSTSIKNASKGLGEGFYNSVTNPKTRVISVGGICEDAIGNAMSGLSAFGSHIGAGSSYGAFIAPLNHIASRTHGIGQQTKKEIKDEPNNPFIIVCGHAGIKTGEDGPTHADPQPLQMYQGNFPRGTCITLTPWEPQEMWPLVTAALKKRPAILPVFVTRPNEIVPDRKAGKLPEPATANKGLYYWRKADRTAKQYNGTIVLQGSEVGIEYFNHVLPKIDSEGLNINILYVASHELFDLLPESDQNSIFTEEMAGESMGITGFTLPTMERWVTSSEGRKRTLYPFRNGHYLGSGKAEMVIREAGLDGESLIKATLDYAKTIEKNKL